MHFLYSRLFRSILRRVKRTHLFYFFRSMSSKHRRRKNRLQGSQWGGTATTSRHKGRVTNHPAPISNAQNQEVASTASFWECPRCTLHNSIERSICDVCQGSRPANTDRTTCGSLRKGSKATSNDQRKTSRRLKSNRRAKQPLDFSTIDSLMRFAEVSIPVPRSSHRGLCWPHISEHPRSAYHCLNQSPEPKPPADSFGPTWNWNPPHVIIVWFRQDLRLDDNPALHAAISTDNSLGKRGPKPLIVPLFVQPTDDEEGGWPCRGAAGFWLDQSLRA